MYAGTYPNPDDPLLLGWNACDGDLLSPSQYSRLFGIIGRRFGGDKTRFALPDFRGRMAVGAGYSE